MRSIKKKKKLLALLKLIAYMTGVSVLLHFTVFLFAGGANGFCMIEPNFFIRYLEIILTALSSLFLFYMGYLVWRKK